MGTRKNIAIIMGGYSSEYDISIKSGEVVYKWLDRAHFSPYRILIRKDKWVMCDPGGDEIPVNRHDFSVATGEGVLHFDCVFNAIHGTPGEDGLMQAYFQLLGIPHTSCDAYAAALTFNKRDLLSVLKTHGVPTARSFSLDRGQTVDSEQIFAAVGLPCFVKANRAGSSFGISLVREKGQLAQALKTAFAEDDQVLIEAALAGTEVSVGVIRHKGRVRVLPITEIVSENDFFDYEAKYKGKSQEITPARISEKAAEHLKQLAQRIYEILGLRGYSRSEFILVDGVPHLLEVNTTPGLTEESILPQQAAAAGIGLSELFGDAISEALSKK